MYPALRKWSCLLLVIPLWMMVEPLLGQSGKAVTMQGTAPPRIPEVREALIIAHEHYSVMVEGVRRKSGVLTLPIKDAIRIRDALIDADFNVTLEKDLPDHAAIERVINAFVDRVRERQAVAFVYYTGRAAGLNLEEDPDTYLIPVQLEDPKSDRHLASQSYPLRALLKKLRNAGTRLELVVVDACRNNPFLDGIPANRKSFVTQGLPRTRVARKDLPAAEGDPELMSARGTAIYYAAQQGDTTPDDGIYAQAWETVLRTPGLDLDKVPSRLNALVTRAGGEMADAHPIFTGQFQFIEAPTPTPTPSPTPAPTPLPEDPFEARARTLGLTWVLIPGGTYERGSESGGSTENPVRSVTVPTFLMSETEITNAQYLACVSAGKCEAPSWDDNKCRIWTEGWFKEGKLPQSLRGNNQPVVCVDWKQAKAFAAWVGGRLASESEWEYAATGGGRTKYSGTDDLSSICQYGNVADQTTGKTNSVWSIEDCNDGYAGTAPVGKFKDGAWGLKDMTGNAWEWTEDCFHKDYVGAPDNGSARTSGCSHSSSRAVRGGGWTNDGYYLGASYRGGFSVGLRDFCVGFRVVRSASRAGVP